MQKLRVNEYFYTLQGEGARAGYPSIFIRLSNCNLKCGFCDTEFTSGVDIGLDELENKIKNYPTKDIVWTGGEPLLQLTKEIVQYFKDKGYYQCIETNGTIPAPSNIDFITLSPKVAEHIVNKNFNIVNELKYVRHKGHLTTPDTSIVADHYYISPQFDGVSYNQENINHCIKLCLENPKWKLTLQTQKLLKIL